MKKIFMCCIIMSVMSAATAFKSDAKALGAEENTSGITDTDRTADIVRNVRRLRSQPDKKVIETQKEKKVASVEQVSGKDIIIRHANSGKSFFMGDKLHLVVNGESITLEVTFPMQTSSKCRIAASESGKLPLIHKGMAVYAGEKAPEVKAEEQVEERTPVRRFRGPNN